MGYINIFGKIWIIEKIIVSLQKLLIVTKMNNINVKKMEDCQGIGVVYDISLDGTVVNALGMNVISNTDG